MQHIGHRTSDEIAQLRQALRELEDANEAVCAGRSKAAYDAMLAAGQGDDLLRLDRARAAARALLSR